MWAILSLSPPQRSAVTDTVSLAASPEPITPVPPPPDDIDPEKIALGARLFNDVRLSADNTVSCSSCHVLSEGGADDMARSRGINGGLSATNAPTVFNSKFNFKQHWDGSEDSLKAQIDRPVHHPQEMGSSWPTITAKLQAEQSYVESFAQLYEDGIKAANIKDAIAAFERTLVTPNSRFDRYLRGESDALTAEEIEGYRLFKDYGCVSCHQGVNVGGNIFAKLGVVRDYFAGQDEITDADLGRFNVTGREEDKHVFKVPSLRLAAVTAPYFHDGSVPTLDKAIYRMGEYQLGVSIPRDDVERISQFLRTLPGDYESPNP